MAYMQYGRKVLCRAVQETSVKRSDGLLHPLLFTGQGIRFRRLEVILTTNMENLGKAGDTVKVAPGYFRNYLMPKLLAVSNIDKFAYLVKEQRKIYQPKEEEKVKVEKETKEDKMKEYIDAAKRLDNGKLVLRRYFKVDNELCEPVTKDEIISEMARQLLVHVEPENLHMPNPLSSLGEYEIPLRLPKSIPLPQGKIMWTLKVKIRRK
ncbi:hypothetical protein RND81_06G112600 [Saponaria officinalis]|uniref:Large ribosomal subunit protein bL9c n=1 Tax=Saponaria officinalis TaxID=3572 RepID=A0AAW1K5Q3_SAPOF